MNHLYAVVDIETTGLWHQEHGITEVAVVHTDGVEARVAFHSLVNPGRHIPGFISQLTGIDSALVNDAPPIEEVLDPLREALQGRIFVAHHANFDYHFIKAAFEKAGHSFEARRLCTLKLARSIIPGLKSYALPSLARQLQIAEIPTHRAGADAMATASLFKVLISLDKEGAIDRALRGKSVSTGIPSHVSTADIDALTTGPGVYYMLGSDGKPLYIGKAKNVRSRVLSHFSSIGSARNRQLFQRLVHRVSCTPVDTEHMAFLLEDAEIRKHRPMLNLAQKDRTASFTVLPYTDRSGLPRLTVMPYRGQTDALADFTSYHAAREWMCALLDSYELGILKPGASYGSDKEDIDPDHLNRAFELMLSEISGHLRGSFALCTKSVSGPFPFALVRNGRYAGFGSINRLGSSKCSFFMKHTTKAPDSSVARSVLNRMQLDPSTIRIELEDKSDEVEV